MQKKYSSTKQSILFAFILGLLGVVFVWTWLLCSIHYTQARNTILQDTQVERVFGDVDYLLPYSGRIIYSDSEVGHFAFYVVGAKKTGTIKVKTLKIGNDIQTAPLSFSS
jgi:hypothetical protein